MNGPGVDYLFLLEPIGFRCKYLHVETKNFPQSIFMLSLDCMCVQSHLLVRWILYVLYDANDYRAIDSEL